jgi:hypothetical protein
MGMPGYGKRAGKFVELGTRAHIPHTDAERSLRSASQLRAVRGEGKAGDLGRVSGEIAADPGVIRRSPQFNSTVIPADGG